VGDEKNLSDVDEITEGNTESNKVAVDDKPVEESAFDTADSSADTGEQGGAGESGPSGGGIEDTSAQIASLNEQLQEAKDQALRAAAEAQNVRRRAQRDVENAHKYGQEKLINSLLPVLDNLDRAIDAIEKASAEGEESSGLKTLLEGVELTRKSALDALQGFKVEVLEPHGEPFDPQFHEAMTMVPSDTAEPNSVIDVLQKGYSLNGRLLRAAMVVVAK